MSLRGEPLFDGLNFKELFGKKPRNIEETDCR